MNLKYFLVSGKELLRVQFTLGSVSEFCHMGISGSAFKVSKPSSIFEKTRLEKDEIFNFFENVGRWGLVQEASSEGAYLFKILTMVH